MTLTDKLQQDGTARAPYRDAWFETNLIRIEDAANYDNETVVLVDGTFDVLHTGHLTLLRCAREAADKLANEAPEPTNPIVIVALYGDEHPIHKPDRPILSWVERQAQVGRLNAVNGGPLVDAVVEVESEMDFQQLATLLSPVARVTGEGDEDTRTPWIPNIIVRRNSPLTSSSIIQRIRSRQGQ